MPEHPNGAITKKGEGRDLNDGVQVTLTTSDTKGTVKAFYDTEMTNRVKGLDLPGTPNPDASTYFGIYEKGSVQFTLQITPDDDGTRKVLVKYVEL